MNSFSQKTVKMIRKNIQKKESKKIIHILKTFNFCNAEIIFLEWKDECEKNQWDEIYNENSYDENSYDENSYDENSYDENSYDENSYDENSYDENSYDDDNVETKSFYFWVSVVMSGCEFTQLVFLEYISVVVWLWWLTGCEFPYLLFLR
ncbi:MAG: hypothetical protein Ta2E_00760 [Mycoplasmoidaceae bacterium]|nr:MAG: hypothetical protein Ta2E_00760 [Mycoplasmoidaceae bacterium]